MSGFSVVIFLFLGSVDNFSTISLYNGAFSTVAFILGALTSTLSGYLGMKIATCKTFFKSFLIFFKLKLNESCLSNSDANARTTLEARKGLNEAFVVAFRSGAVMGFLLSANGLFVLFFTIIGFKAYYGDDWESLFEAIAGYGLGGSSVALFGRVGGGIYTKAADVGADLVGKIEQGIPEDDPRNPAVGFFAFNPFFALLFEWELCFQVIADNVGDNVGDIAGMGSDLFGSFAESTCAALVVSSLSSFGEDHNLVAMLFPLFISASGILVCIVTTFFATDFANIHAKKDIEPALKKQLIISTVLMTPVIFLVAFFALPSEFTITVVGQAPKVVQNWLAVI